MGNHKRGETSATMGQYIETLVAEIEATPVLGACEAQATQPLETVFFGGGTPSLLAVSQLETILTALDRRFGIASTAEVSMEMDPATFNLSHAQGYRAAGINRVSLGAQAFQDKLLAAAGRFHRRADIARAVALLRQAGFENISLDLMSGLPHHTLAQWESSLREAIALHPTHLSIYDLIVEPQTAFARYFTPGEAPLPSDRLTAEMYNMAQAMLVAHGYDHYEICNYAQPGYESRHNLTYWLCHPNYGFGMGATSYLPQPSGPQRIDRPRTQATYRTWVEAFAQNSGTTADPTLPPSEQVLETIMMGLRLKPGISVDEIYRVYGEAGLVELGQAIAPHVANRWVIIEPAACHSGDSPVAQKILKPSHRIRLSDPQGFLMSNVVITDAFNALEKVTSANR